jgi:hypothetical protein
VVSKQLRRVRLRSCDEFLPGVDAFECARCASFDTAASRTLAAASTSVVRWLLHTGAWLLPACTELGQQTSAFSAELRAPNGTPPRRLTALIQVGAVHSLRKFFVCVTRCLLGSIASK